MSKANKATATAANAADDVKSIIAGLVKPFVEHISLSNQVGKLADVIKAGIEKLRKACGSTELGRAKFRSGTDSLRKSLVGQTLPDGKKITRQRVSDAFRSFGIEKRKSSKKGPNLFSDAEISEGSEAIFAFPWVAKEKDELAQAELATKFAFLVAKQCGKLTRDIKDARKDAAKK